MPRLEGKVAVVSGAASGIGKGVALRFAAEGAIIIAADINPDGAAQTVAEITELGGQAISASLDVASEDGWTKLFATVLAQFGQVNILCNIAGIASIIDLEEFPLDEWNRQIAVNLTGVFLGCKAGVKAIKQSGAPGAIVNLGSLSGILGHPGQAGYNASKGGVRVLTKSVALYCARKGYPIRCNAVHPSYVDTAMFDPLAPLFPNRQAMLNEFAKDVPLGKVATPDDVAQACLFLCSDESAMITGTEILVDGGHSAGFVSRFEAEEFLTDDLKR